METSSECIYNILKDEAEVDYLTIETAKNIGITKGHVYFCETKVSRFYKNILKIIRNKKIAWFLTRVFNKFGIFKKYTKESMLGSVNKKKFLKLAEKLIQKNHYDCVVSVSMPMICQYMALWIKNKYPNLKWIIYELDPFVYNKTLNNKKIERRKKQAALLYERADVFFCVPCIKKYNEKMNYYPRYHAHSIPIELPKLIPIANKKTCNLGNGTVKIIYVGTFYKDIRNPKKMLQFFAGMKYDFCLNIFGRGCEEELFKYKIF